MACIFIYSSLLILVILGFIQKNNWAQMPKKYFHKKMLFLQTKTYFRDHLGTHIVINFSIWLYIGQRGLTTKNRIFYVILYNIDNI